MGVPATTGKRCTSLADMEIGDYIACKYYAPSANAAGVFSDLGGSGTELPVTPGATANGYFYFLKVAKGLCIADRMIQQQISWAAINNANCVNGKETEYGLIRMLSSSEYDKYLTNSNLNGAITVRAPWNSPKQTTYINFEISYDTVSPPYKKYYSFLCEATSSISSTNVIMKYNIDGSSYNKSSYVMGRVLNTRYPAEFTIGTCYLPKIAAATNTTYQVSAESHYSSHKNRYVYIYLTGCICFRPVLEFMDNKKSTNIWY